MQLSLKNLVDIARSGSTHKTAAEQLWNEIQVLKRCSPPQATIQSAAWNTYSVYQDAQQQWAYGR